MRRVTRAPGPLVAAGAALALALVLGVGAFAGPTVLLPGLLLGQIAVLVGWYRALEVPGGYVGRAVAGAAAAAADVVVVAGAGERPLSGVGAVLALSVLGALLQQLARRDGRDHLTTSLAATVAATVLTVLGCSYLAVLDLSVGTALVAAAGAGAAVTVAASQAVTLVLTDSRQQALAGPLLGVLTAAGAGSLVGAAGDLRLTLAVAVAVAAAGLAAAVGQFVARVPAPNQLLAGTLPVVLAGPVAYVLGSLLAT